jgi:hypothetical protein
MSVTALTSLVQGLLSLTTATFVTAFTPAVAGRYSLAWSRPNYATSNAYSGVAELVYDGSALYLMSSTVGANTAIQLSSGAVQLKQTSGLTQNASWAYTFTPFQ